MRQTFNVAIDMQRVNSPRDLRRLLLAVADEVGNGQHHGPIIGSNGKTVGNFQIASDRVNAPISCKSARWSPR